jgi:DNA-binding winged helix-turn-helix (wHTH) protein
MILAFGDFELDPKRRTLSWQGTRVTLLSRPFDILVFLIGARDRVVSRDDMQTTIWPGQIVTANNLTVQISLLRRALAQYDSNEMIITVPGRGYRFIGEVVVREDCLAAPPARPAVPPVPHPALERTRGGRVLLRAGNAPSAALAAAGFAAIALAAAVLLPRPSGGSFPVHVQVETVPDTVTMVPGGYCRVDYVFRVSDQTDLQLATEDVSFHFTSGEPIGRVSLGGRIYHGSFPIRGRGTGVYHNNIWLPPDVAAAVRAGKRDELYLRHGFHLVDPKGDEIIVPAVLKIVFGPSEDACAVPAGR